jgi:hypothetical protein
MMRLLFVLALATAVLARRADPGEWLESLRAVHATE